MALWNRPNTMIQGSPQRVFLSAFQGPMACEDINGVSGKAARAWLSRPGLGKHISFDGRYLHAAPSDLALPLASEAPPAQSTPSPLSVGGGRDDGAPEEAAAG